MKPNTNGNNTSRLSSPSTTSCDEQCWTPVPCPNHPEHYMHPRGRSVPLEAHVCCEARNSRFNTMHLFSEHDSTRWYVDPDGWAQHVAHCDQGCTL